MILFISRFKISDVIANSVSEFAPEFGNESKLFKEKTDPVFKEIQRLAREGKEQNKEQIENLQKQIDELAEEYRKTVKKIRIVAERKY